MSTPELRLATEADLPAINAIHAHYVRNTCSTYALEPLTLEARHAWFTGRPEIHPVTVVEDDGQILAWGSLGTFRTLAGYSTTVENSIYVHPNHVRRGLGSVILRDQMERVRTLDLHSIIAVIDSEQVASIRLHLKFGFHEAGRFTQLARKFDTWHDTVFMQWVINS